jgi:hypothetical protein
MPELGNHRFLMTAHLFAKMQYDPHFIKWPTNQCEVQQRRIAAKETEASGTPAEVHHAQQEEKETNMSYVCVRAHVCTGGSREMRRERERERERGGERERGRGGGERRKTREAEIMKRPLLGDDSRKQAGAAKQHYQRCAWRTTSVWRVYVCVLTAVAGGTHEIHM